MKIENSTLILDDFVTDEDGGKWTQLCDKHSDHLSEENANGIISNGGSGICGVEGCSIESKWYYDF